MDNFQKDRRDICKKLIFSLGGILICSQSIFSISFKTNKISEWYHTLESMEKIYKQEYNEGKHIENYITENYVATSLGQKGKIPKKFIDNTLNHLEKMLIKNWAKYIFRLDSFHSHLFLPIKIKNKLIYRAGIESIQEYIKEKELGGLYHNSEHLALRNPIRTGKIDIEAQKLISKRSVLGWYNERPIEQTHPLSTDLLAIIKANNASIPENYGKVGNLIFKAHKNGVFSIKPFQEEIRIDFSFDSNYH